MDAQQEFAAEQRAVVRAQRLAQEEAAEVRADQARLAEATARRDAMWDAARRTGRPVPSTAGILGRAREVFAAEDDRDAATAYGSQARPAVWWTRADGSPVEVSARPAGVARSASQAADDALLRRARELHADSFMAVQVHRFQRRRSDSERTVARVESGTGWPGVISR